MPGGFTRFATRRPALAAPSLSSFFYGFLDESDELALFGYVVEWCESEFGGYGSDYDTGSGDGSGGD